MEADFAGQGDHRQLRREFQAITQGTKRFETADEVIAAFTAPLIRLFGEVDLPVSIKTLSHSSGSSHSTVWAESVDVLLVEAVQESLVLRIHVDWAATIDSAQFRDLVNVWFFGIPSHQQVVVQQCALRTISRLLTTSNLHPLTLDRLKLICIDALTQLSLPALIRAVVGMENKARTDVIWTETLWLLSTLPDRLANATLGKLPPSFSTTVWIERVFVHGIVTTLDKASLEQPEFKRLKDVISRLDRMGYLSKAIDTERRGFWSTFLQSALQNQGASKNWSRLRAKLGRGAREKLDVALVETLQYLTTRAGLTGGLVTGRERGKAGTEGTKFLSKTSQSAVAALAQLLGPLLGSSSEANDGSDSDSDPDDDDDGTPTSQAVKNFTAIALSAIQQSPLLAWSWTIYLSTTKIPPSDLLTCLEYTLDHWSEPARISRSIRTEELFLTTLVVCLISSFSSPSNISPELKDQLAALSRSKVALDGISAHLQHSDPTIQRLGMLVAELLSAKSPSPGGKTLNFGTKIWNGVGEGREEARVLRAVSDAWAYHTTCVSEIWKGWGPNHFSAAVRSLIHTTEMVSSDAVTSIATVKKARSNGTKPRSLPKRIDPPPRSSHKSRPLITMINSSSGEEDEVDAGQPARPSPLTMFSRPSDSAQQDDSCSGSNSSSSDDESDSDAGGAAGSSEHEIHRLAAELSGLNPSDASNILQSNPLLPTDSNKKPRPGEKIDDFEADREAHAPQFDRKTAPPVYISQLSPLLKSSSRSDIRLGLHHAAPLIRRKSRTELFGAEVSENAVDLTLTLIALHDKFGIKRFESMRRDALVAVAVAVPKIAVGVVGEQVFGSQYSNVQRIAMLRTLVESALELTGKKSSEEIEVGRRVDKAVSKVVASAKAVGENRVPAIKRERNLHIANPVPTKSSGSLIQELNPIHSTTNLAPGGTRESASQDWASLVSNVYVFPLINRFLAYQSHFSRVSSTRGYLGAGRGSMFTPETLGFFLDSLTVLVSLSPPHLLPLITPTVLELVSSLLVGPTSNPSVSVDTASTLTLIAILIHTNIDADGGQLLLENAQNLAVCRRILVVVQELFSQLQSLQDLNEGNTYGVRGRILTRAATILLLMDQLDQNRHEAIRHKLGFIPL